MQIRNQKDYHSTLNFAISEDRARSYAKRMFNQLNTKNKKYLEEEEVLKILKLSYQGLK